MPKEDLWGKLERQCQGALDRWQGEAREASPGGVETLDQAGGAGCIERRGWGGQELEDGEVPGGGWVLVGLGWGKVGRRGLRVGDGTRVGELCLESVGPTEGDEYNFKVRIRIRIYSG